SCEALHKMSSILSSDSVCSRSAVEQKSLTWRAVTIKFFILFKVKNIFFLYYLRRIAYQQRLCQEEFSTNEEIDRQRMRAQSRVRKSWGMKEARSSGREISVHSGPIPTLCEEKNFFVMSSPWAG